MSADYRPMWRDLGLDLEAHDALLAVLGPLYEGTFTKQPNRPAGMEYFDFVMSEVHGLRIKELLDAKDAGRKVVGAFCTFVPEEIVLALDGVMVGLCAGAEFATAEAEKYLPLVPESPQTVAALGCALRGLEEGRRGGKVAEGR